MTIPIVFSTDHNFIMPTSVALVSLLECSTDCSLQIFILQSDDVTDQDRSSLDELCKRHGAELHWISLGDSFKGAHEIRGITIFTYYRLMIPWLPQKWIRYCIAMEILSFYNQFLRFFHSILGIAILEEYVLVAL